MTTFIVVKNRKLLIYLGILLTIMAAAMLMFQPIQEAGIRKKCVSAAEKLMGNKNIKLMITSKGEDTDSTIVLYYDLKDGEPRWYRMENDQTGKHEIFVMNGTEYERYDPEGSVAGIKTSWETNTNMGLLDQIPEYIEKKQRNLHYPQELNSVFNRSNEKEQYASVRQLTDGRYEFQYSTLALESKQKERIHEAEQNYQWLLEATISGEDLENSELYLLSSQVAVRQAEEIRETGLTEWISLDEFGNIKMLESVLTVEMRSVMPDLRTGKVIVSDKTNILEGYSRIEVESTDDPSITEFLDKIAASVEFKMPDINNE